MCIKIFIFSIKFTMQKVATGHVSNEMYRGPIVVINVYDRLQKKTVVTTKGIYILTNDCGREHGIGPP